MSEQTDLTAVRLADNDILQGALGEFAGQMLNDEGNVNLPPLDGLGAQLFALAGRNPFPVRSGGEAEDGPGSEAAKDSFVWVAEELDGGHDFIADFSLGSDMLDFNKAGITMDSLLAALETKALTVDLLDADILQLILHPGHEYGDGLKLDVHMAGDSNGLLASFASADTPLNEVAEMEAARNLLAIMLQNG
ncbi:hypothetical protein FACS1894206_09660 [Deltaproteobacteria bacterium]|nr:hypothetical protein FACS1894206_09660 [Deltaproteobacteria bacterium]